MIGTKNQGYTFPNPANLFRKRLISHIRDRVRVLRSVADDWTVFLYILIPGLLLGGRLYYGLWKEPLPAWAAQLPFSVVLALLLLTASLSSILLLIREADVLFVIQRKAWLHGVMVRSSLYSMAVAALKTSIFYLIVLPFLVRQFHQDSLSLVSLLLFTIAFEWVLMWSKHLVRVQTGGWRRRLLYIPFVFVPSGMYGAFAAWFRLQPFALGLGTIILVVVSLLLIIVRLRLRGTFMNDVQEDLTNRTDLTSVVLSQTVDKPRRIRKKTWIYRRSGHVFRSTLPSRRIAGAMIKTLLRHPKQSMLYLQFTGISLLVLLTLPIGIKVIAFAGLIMLLTYWLFLQWFGFRQDPFVSLLPWPDDQHLQGSHLAMGTLLSPFAVLTSAAVLFTSPVNVWIAVIGFVPLAAASAWIAPQAMRMFMLNRKYGSP
ncbi:ABC transporter permease [Paenibacillus chibensis]|uniref:ABC transporter permease n=1 Tax=Paenibacillus chibensis TaxID=59846 RepID=UPI000FD9E1A2|nr:ABC transporter permease [Paenibacillus chibensis]